MDVKIRNGRCIVYMKVCIYDEKCKDAMSVRINVFVDEQGFRDEFDNIDDIAKHIVVYDGELPIGTCRVFSDIDDREYVLGRLAVIKEYRKQGIGAVLMRAAEDIVSKENGQGLKLHAQCRVKEFYNKLGYIEYGDVEDDEGEPHIWMKKAL